MISRRPSVRAALARLRSAAEDARTWPVTSWGRVSGPAPDRIELVRGQFSGSMLGRRAETVLAWKVDVPETMVGVRIAGDPLELTVESLFPIHLRHQDRVVLDSPTVAPGPALVTVIPELQRGDNGTVTLSVTTPDNQVGQWLRLAFTTPGLRARFELLDVTWARLALAEAVAADDAGRAAVDRAVDLLPADLAGLDTARLTSALDAACVALEPLADDVGRLRVHLIGHSHIDMNWQWTWTDTAEVIVRDLASVADLMDQYPEMTFTHSQPVTYEVVRRRDPALFSRIVAHIRSGRWEAATLQWVEGDTNMASGESTVRQLLEAVRWTREVLGVQPTTHLAPDTFGHAGNLPQLTASAGAQRYYHHRCNPGGTELYPAYWWEGQDGTRVLALSTFSYNGDLTPAALAISALHALDHGHQVALHFHGMGNHGGGPARQNLDMVRRLQEQPGLPELRFSTLERYGDDLLGGAPSLPVHVGESPTVFEGCYTTHADVKAHNRRGENLLATADALAVLAGRDHRSRLDAAWRTLLFHQFHDILDGSAIHEAYEQTAEDADTVELTAQGVIDEALVMLAVGVDAGSIVVVNPTGIPRTDVVVVPGVVADGPLWLVDERGDRVAGQPTDAGLCLVATCAAFGTSVYRVEPAGGGAPDAMIVTAVLSPVESRLTELVADDERRDEELPYLRVVTPDLEVHVRRDCGVITGLLDRRTGHQLVGYGMRRLSDYQDSARPDLAINVLQVLDEHPHGMSSWHLDEVWRETSLLRGAETTVLERGPVRTVLQTRHRIRSSTIDQRMILYAQLPRIDVELEVDWRELGSPQDGVPDLKVAVTARLDTVNAWFETPYGAVRRPADGQEVPALRWADVSSDTEGIAILNDSRHGHDALGSRLRLTLLRSGYEPDPVSDAGRHQVRYSIVPHPGDAFAAGIPALAVGFNQPLLGRRVHDAAPAGPGPHDGWRPRVDAGSVLIGALKTARDGGGDVIIRLAETSGRDEVTTVRGLPPGSRVTEVNVVEDQLARLALDAGQLHLAFRPWQVRTLRVSP